MPSWDDVNRIALAPAETAEGSILGARVEIALADLEELLAEGWLWGALKRLIRSHLED